MSSESTHTRRSLITTASEEFWDTSLPVVFLGEWCRRYSRRDAWAGLGDLVVPNLWAKPSDAYCSYTLVQEIYERMLPPVATALNVVHNTSWSNRYWRIVAGPWLQWFIGILYERFATIECALSHYPDLISIGVEESSWVVPKDTLDFISLVHEDAYNLQLYTSLLRNRGVPLKFKSCEIRKNEGTVRSDGLTARTAKLLKRLASSEKLRGPRAKSMWIDHTYFSSVMQASLLLKTRGSVKPIGSEMSPTTIPGAGALRSSLQIEAESKNDFEALLFRAIPDNIPRSFVEDFARVRAIASNSYSPEPAAIFSANSWYGKEPFKQWAAAAAEHGTILLGTQHGGNYGSTDPMQAEEHETAITDRYYSWGWEREGRRAAVIPMPAPKLAGRKLIGPNKKRRGILFVATSGPRYQFAFPNTSCFHNEYLDWQRRFFLHLAPEARDETVVRLHYEDFGWDIRARLKDRFPHLKFGDWGVPFLKALSQCRLYVCDHLSTTFLEALAADVPSVLFWDPKWNRLRHEAEPYYAELRSAGILFDTPEDAAVAIGSIQDVSQWWNRQQVQTARALFCARFARTSTDPVRRWVAELKEVLCSADSLRQEEAEK